MATMGIERLRKAGMAALRLLVLAIACCMIASLVGCGSHGPSVEASGNEAAAVGAGEAASDAQGPGASSSFDAPDEATPSTAGPLHVEGTQLMSANGQPVQLRGVSTHGLSWFPEYVNQDLFDELRTDWNANVVRLALYTAEYNGYNTGGDQAQLRQLVLDGVEYARNADLYAVVDWHTLSDGDPNAYVDAAIAYFDEMSRTLAGADNVLYEICNEPNGGTSWASVKAYAERVIPVIRANDPDAVVLVGTPEWSQRLDEAAADPLAFENVMYTLHFYAATHQQDLRDVLASAVSGGLPVFVSEFGICDASGNGAIDIASADAWVALMDQLDVSYICWNLSNKDEASALIHPSIAKTSGFAEDDLSAEGQWLFEVLHD